jgi:hypothetical protein
VLDRPKDRWKRYRSRQRDRLAIAPVTYDAVVIELLIATQWLAERDAADRRKVGLAIGRMLAASAKARG